MSIRYSDPAWRPFFPLLTSRLVRFQFKRNGRIHLMTCYDNPPGRPEYHVAMGPTLCGKETQIGQGGWGYSGKKCEECWKLGHPAEKVPVRVGQRLSR